MHIQWVSVENLPPLKDVYFDCDKQVNLFIGPNAAGKSTILKAIEDISSTWGRTWGRSDEFKDGNAYPIYTKMYKPGIVHIGVNYGCPVNTAYYPQGADHTGSGASIWETMPFLYITATRVSLRPQSLFSKTILRPEPYGSNLTWNDILNRHFRNSWGDFNGEYVENIVHRFRGELGDNRRSQNQLRKAIEVGYACTKTICPEGNT